jgi:hypothetical protein
VKIASGAVSAHPVNDSEANNIYGGLLGADGRMWFRTLGSKVMALGQDGVVQTVTTAPRETTLSALQARPDGRMWPVTRREAKAAGAIETGRVVVTQAQNDDFANRVVLTRIAGTVGAPSVLASAQFGEPAHTGHLASKSLWWTWTAPKNGTLALNTFGSTPANAITAYSGTALNDLIRLPGAGQSRMTLPVRAGDTYHIAVDAYGSTGGYALLTFAFED